ncbi:hypothetical protein WAI453_004742 [Rhynchosporium graminicola]
MEVVKRTSIFGSWRGRSQARQAPTLPLQRLPPSSFVETDDGPSPLYTPSYPERENIYGLLPLNDLTTQKRYSPSSRQYPVDIIAIHGITGDAYTTWTDEETSYFWLRDSLPKEFPGARIFSFGYRSKVAFTLDTGDFESLAEDLLEDVYDTRISEEDKRRPLIFVCHSMGGIVVKKALNICHIEPRYTRILSAVESILFLATPHGGAKPAEFAATVSRLGNLPIASRFIGRSRTDLLKSLSRNSKPLHTISKEFRHHTTGIQIFSFIEGALTLPLKDLLVDKSSGSMGVATENIIHMSGCDHRRICRFKSENSQAYKMVSNKLREVVEKATTKLENDMREEDIPCLHSLAFPTMHDRVKAASTAHPSTCTWLLAHPIFKSWLTLPNLLASPSPKSLLWIKGHPGTGKSTLMAFLHNHLTAAHPRNIHLSFFFNANGTLLQRSELGMLRSLTHQLYRLSPAARHIIFRTFKEKTQEFGEYYQHWEWNTEDLRALLLDILCMKPRRGEEIVIFIDALDEADGQDDPLLAGRLVEYFHGLSDRMLGTGSTTKMIISCRHYPVIATNLGMVINIEEGNTEDIAVYAEDQLRNGVQGWAQEQEIARKALEQAIVTKAEGVFLWVRLRLPKIIKSLNDGAWTLRRAPQLLQAESNELFTQYEDILIQKIDISLRKKSLHFLQWICLAERPLSVSEIRFAMACDDESMELDVKRCQDTAGFVDSDERMRLLIKSLSGGLVEFRQHEHGTTVQPFHQTITSFLRIRGLQALGNLLRPMGGSESNNDMIGAAEQRLSLSCLNYLSSDEVGQAAKGAVIGIERRLTFVQYATKYWIKHAERAERNGIKQNGLVNRLASGTGLFEMWKLLLREVDRGNTIGDSDLLHVMAASNILSAVRELLDRGTSIDDEDAQGNTALYYAAQNGHVSMTEMLIKRGANVDLMDRYGWTPLKTAAEKGHLAIVRLLLKHGADMNENTGPAKTALQKAAGQGNLRLVTILVKCGANVNETGGFQGISCTALQAAVSFGHQHVVEYFIHQGADLNVRGGMYGCALQAAIFAEASEARRRSIVELLLEYNVDVNVQGGEYGNALQAAIIQGETYITELLLTNGANVRAEGGKYGNAFQAACFMRYTELVERLLAFGIDIDAEGGEYGSAIQAAASRPDNEKVIALLLQYGANVNRYGGLYGSALQAAAQCPGALGVDMLIKHGADIHAQGGRYGNVLQAAVAGGNEEIAKILVGAGLDINQSGGEYGHTLQASIPLCKEAFIRYLLDEGADINIQGGKYGNALRAAVYWKRGSIIKLLLNRGALPDFHGMESSHNTPLHLAADRGYLGIVKQLLSHGADVNRQTRYSTPALAAAITGGHKAIVELLLDSGADPDLPDRTYQSFGMRFSIADGNQDIAMLLEKRRQRISG